MDANSISALECHLICINYEFVAPITGMSEFDLS